MTTEQVIAHRLMTPEEYAAMPIKGWHAVCRDYDGAGGTAIRYGDADMCVELSEENDRLIVERNDLLEVCREIMSQVDEHGYFIGFGIAGKLRSVIVKAERRERAQLAAARLRSETDETHTSTVPAS